MAHMLARGVDVGVDLAATSAAVDASGGGGFACGLLAWHEARYQLSATLSTLPTLPTSFEAAIADGPRPRGGTLSSQWRYYLSLSCRSASARCCQPPPPPPRCPCTSLYTLIDPSSTPAEVYLAGRPGSVAQRTRTLRLSKVGGLLDLAAPAPVRAEFGLPSPRPASSVANLIPSLFCPIEPA